MRLPYFCVTLSYFYPYNQTVMKNLRKNTAYFVHSTSIAPRSAHECVGLGNNTSQREREK